jgi:hypothetical protein
MRDPRVTRIAAVYADQLTAASQNAVRTGWVLLVLSGLLWAFFLTAVPPDAREQQIYTPIGATAFALVLLLVFYPLRRVGWRESVRPRIRAFIDGNRVEGTIESVETTNRMIPRRGFGNGENAGQLMKQFVYRYTLNGRVIQRTTVPFPPSLIGGRAPGDSIPVYVWAGDPEHGEADVYRIREP